MIAKKTYIFLPKEHHDQLIDFLNSLEYRPFSFTMNVKTSKPNKEMKQEISNAIEQADLIDDDEVFVLVYFDIEEQTNKVLIKTYREKTIVALKILFG